MNYTIDASVFISSARTQESRHPVKDMLQRGTAVVATITSNSQLSGKVVKMIELVERVSALERQVV